MKNWSQKITWSPSQIAYPETEEAIIRLVHQANDKQKKIRIIGSIHSFNPLWVTDDVVMSLQNYQGIVHINKAELTATIKAGTTLHLLGDLLFQQGLAMENLGDIDKQTIAGSISTATHGTGFQLGTISTQVMAIRFINGKGEVVNCSKDKNVDLFKAAQVSLGALGIITQLTLQCVPAYKLKLSNQKEDLQTVIQTFNERITNNRNFEFYWFPKSNTAYTKTSNIVEDVPDKVGVFNYLTEYVLENYTYKFICELARAIPALSDRLSKFSASAASNVHKICHSHKVYATPRLVRFSEMEYNVPLEVYPTVINEIIETINQHNFNIVFPIENRVVQADDAYLSPAYERNAVYIACHVYHKKDYTNYFKVLEKIFLKYDGRPHWAKLHTLSATELSKKYPKFEAFNRHRIEQDPNEIFMNDYLKKILILPKN